MIEPQLIQKMSVNFQTRTEGTGLHFNAVKRCMGTGSQGGMEPVLSTLKNWINNKLKNKTEEK